MSMVLDYSLTNSYQKIQWYGSLIQGLILFSQLTSYANELRWPAEDHRQHRGAAAHCEDTVAPGACCAGAVSERAAARGARGRLGSPACCELEDKSRFH